MPSTTSVTNRALRARLRKLGACSEAMTWVGKRDLRAAWNECQSAEWLLWAAGQIGMPLPLIVECGVRCAETALQYVPAGEDRPRLALEATRAWLADPTEENLRRVVEASAAAWAASAAARAASDAAWAAASAAAGAAAQQQHADFVREVISFDVMLAALEEV